MKESFWLSSNFEGTVDELGYWMEEILTQEKSLATKIGRLEWQLDELVSFNKMRKNQIQQDLEEDLASNNQNLAKLQNQIENQKHIKDLEIRLIVQIVAMDSLHHSSIELKQKLEAKKKFALKL